MHEVNKLMCQMSAPNAFNAYSIPRHTKLLEKKLSMLIIFWTPNEPGTRAEANILCFRPGPTQIGLCTSQMQATG